MTPREVIAANIECNCDERIGFNYHGFPEARCDMTMCGLDTSGIEKKRWVEGDFEYYTDDWGNLWHRLKDGCALGEIYKPVLEDWDELDNLELPDLGHPDRFAKARELAASDTDRFRIGFMGWPFAIARYMRKMEIYFMDLVAERERIDILHDRITTILEAVVDGYGKTGIDAVMFGEDLGVQDRLLMSPEMWRDIFRPLYERLTSRAHSHGLKVIMHSCGYNWLLVDDLCQAGIDCLQFDQPGVYDQPALAAKLRQYGVGLFSPCDIQKVLPTGDKAFIEAETERLVETFRGGFICTRYPDLRGIGVKEEWDRWAYDTFVRCGVGCGVE